MSVFTVMQCESCDAQVKFNPMERIYERTLPDTWITLFQGNPQGSEGWHFCSMGCLSAWADEKARQGR